MSTFKQDAQELLKLVGGKDNIQAVTHCATRLRFVLKVPSQADTEKIEELDSVMGSFTQSGQFQVIIGNKVAEFYKEFQAVSDTQQDTKEAVNQAALQHQTYLQRAVSFLAEIFAPIIPAIIVGGLILGFRNILGGVGCSVFGQKIVDGVALTTSTGEPVYNTLTDISTFWQGVNHFLWLPGEAIFHFLPVGITWSVTRKMKTTEILGIVLGVTLVSPQLLNAYGVASAMADGSIAKWQWEFGYFHMSRIGYQAQVIPALLAGLTLSHLEIMWRRVIPEMMSMIFVPFLSLLPAVILAHTVLGPVGWAIGHTISSVVLVGLTGTFSWLFGAIFGAFYAPLVITGLHHMTNAIDVQLISDVGGTGLWPLIALSNIAQGSAVFGVWLLTRHNKQETQITIPSMVSAYLGVTEPAMFGVNLKYQSPFVAGMIGSSCAGLVATTFKVTANAIGVGGLPGFLVIQPQSMLMFFVCIAIAIVVPIILTLFFHKANLFEKK